MIGIIGGSGLYQMPGLADVEERQLATPFGEPSDALILGTLDGVRLAFLSRHGRGHRHSPSEVPYRANIFAMKQLGVEQILSLSAVGSLKADRRPLDFVLPDQFIDRTQHRIATFFGTGAGAGLVAHVGFADPTCARLRAALAEACGSAGVTVHSGGTYINMEGPAFSTRAESHLYRAWGADVIGMTNLTEAKLAREAEICYVSVAMVTDFDCWHPDHDAVTVTEIISNLTRNAANAATVVRATVAGLATAPRSCACGSALKHALITDPKLVPAATRTALAPLIGKYLT